MGLSDLNKLCQVIERLTTISPEPTASLSRTAGLCPLCDYNIPHLAQEINPPKYDSAKCTNLGIHESVFLVNFLLDKSTGDVV